MSEQNVFKSRLASSRTNEERTVNVNISKPSNTKEKINQLKRRVVVAQYKAKKASEIPLIQTYTQEAATTREIRETEQAKENLESLKALKSQMLSTPDQKYIIGGNNALANIGGPSVTVSGSYVVEHSLNPAIETSKEYYKYKQDTLSYISGLHPSAKVIYSPDKISVKHDVVTEAQSEWKTLNPLQQIGKTVWTTVTHFPETMYNAILSPVGLAPGVKEYQRNLITWEASTWQMAKEKDYIGIVKEAAWNPLTQEVVIVGLTMGLAKVAPIVGRGLVKGGYKTGSFVYKTVGEIIPLNRFIPKSLVESLGKSSIARDIYHWGVKGWRFGYRPISEGAETFRKTLSVGGESYELTGKVITSSSKMERVLMSPEGWANAQSRLTSRLGTTFDIIRTPEGLKGPGTIKGVYATETKIVGKKLVTRSLYLEKIPTIIKNPSSFYSAGIELGGDISKMYSVQGFSRELQKQGLIEIGETITNKGLTKITTGYARRPIFTQYGFAVTDDFTGGIVKQVNTRFYNLPGKYLSGFGYSEKLGMYGWKLPTIDPNAVNIFSKNALAASKKYMKGYFIRHPWEWLKTTIKGSSKGTMSLVPEISIPRVENIMVSKTVSGGGRAGLLYRLSSAPVFGSGSVVVPNVNVVLWGGLSFGSRINPEIRKWEVPNIKYDRDINYFSALAPAVKPAYKISNISKVGTRQFQDVFPVVTTVNENILDVVVSQVVKAKPVYEPPSVPFYDIPYVSIPFVPLGGSLDGGGRQHFGWGVWDVEKKFRMKKTFDPFAGYDLFGNNKKGR